jgi:hypothetical protein
MRENLIEQYELHRGCSFFIREFASGLCDSWRTMSLPFARARINLRRKKERKLANGMTFEEVREKFDNFTFEHTRNRFEMANQAKQLEEKRRQGREYTQ